MRVASKEVLVVFFLKPDERSDCIDYDAAANLYHNRYNRTSLEAVVRMHPRCDGLEWRDINHQEILLSIKIKE